MISRIYLSVALLCSTGAAFAQTPAQQPPAATPAQPAPGAAEQAAVGQTAAAFGQCIQTAIQGLAATVAPEAGATTVLGGCVTQRQQLEQALEALIATMPADQQAAAREQVRTQMAAAETQIAAAISRARAAPAAAAPAAQ
jgi:hypothetical protein